jgi:hypothetical protein
MSKHLADHRSSSNGGRVKHFMALARDRGEAVWRAVWQKAATRGDGNRRVVEYVRIERGRSEQP